MKTVHDALTKAAEICEKMSPVRNRTASHCAAAILALRDSLPAEPEPCSIEGMIASERRREARPRHSLMDDADALARLPKADALPQEGREGAQRSCTCHPDDNPPVPCPHKYALSECRKAAAPVSGETPRTKARIERLLGPVEKGGNRDPQVRFADMCEHAEKLELELNALRSEPERGGAAEVAEDLWEAVREWREAGDALHLLTSKPNFAHVLSKADLKSLEARYKVAVDHLHALAAAPSPSGDGNPK